MWRTRDHDRRWWGTVVAMLAATAAVGSGTASAAPPVTPPPQLTLIAAAKSVNLVRYADDPGNWLDVGAHVVAGAGPLDIRVNRASYAAPIVARQIITEHGRQRTRTLPAGLVTSFSGFSAFTHVSLADATGMTVFERDDDFCPNTFGTARTRVDAPDASPYPRFCPRAPFTLGAVWGVQAGWSAALAPEEPRFGPVDVPDGSYTVTVSVNPPYRKLFGIPVDRATVKVAMTVRTIAGPGEGPGSRAVAAPSGSPGRAAGNGRRLPDRSSHDRSSHHRSSHGQATSDSAPGLAPLARRPTIGLRTRASAAAGPRPDLRALPAWWINLSKEADDDHDYLSFDATVWNAGTSPLVVDGFRRTGTDVMDAYQYFFDASGKQTGYIPAGTMQWDPRDGHDHWHLTGFARYRLLDATKKLAVRSGKEGFCLANTDAVDYTVPNAEWQPTNTDLSTACGRESSPAVRQVLDIGNGDTYAQYQPGQSFDITDVPNGTYYIEVAANPEKRFAETNTANNSSLRKVVLGGVPGRRTLKVPPHHGIDG